MRNEDADMPVLRAERRCRGRNDDNDEGDSGRGDPGQGWSGFPLQKQLAFLAVDPRVGRARLSSNWTALVGVTARRRKEVEASWFLQMAQKGRRPGTAGFADSLPRPRGPRRFGFVFHPAPGTRRTSSAACPPCTMAMLCRLSVELGSGARLAAIKRVQYSTVRTVRVDGSHGSDRLLAPRLGEPTPSIHHKSEWGDQRE